MVALSGVGDLLRVPGVQKVLREGEGDLISIFVTLASDALG